MECMPPSSSRQAAEEALEAQLPEVRRLLRLPSLHFVSVQGQGDYLIEAREWRREPCCEGISRPWLLVGWLGQSCPVCLPKHEILKISIGSPIVHCA